MLTVRWAKMNNKLTMNLLPRLGTGRSSPGVAAVAAPELTRQWSIPSAIRNMILTFEFVTGKKKEDWKFEAAAAPTFYDGYIRYDKVFQLDVKTYALEN